MLHQCLFLDTVYITILQFLSVVETWNVSVKMLMWHAPVLDHGFQGIDRYANSLLPTVIKAKCHTIASIIGQRKAYISISILMCYCSNLAILRISCYAAMMVSYKHTHTCSKSKSAYTTWLICSYQSVCTWATFVHRAFNQSQHML